MNELDPDLPDEAVFLNGPEMGGTAAFGAAYLPQIVESLPALPNTLVPDPPSGRRQHGRNENGSGWVAERLTVGRPDSGSCLILQPQEDGAIPRVLETLNENVNMRGLTPLTPPLMLPQVRRWPWKATRR